METYTSGPPLKFSVLLAGLLATFVIGPVFEKSVHLSWVPLAFVSAVLVNAIWLLSHKRGHLLLSALLAAPLFTGNVIAIFSVQVPWVRGLDILTHLSGILFFAYVSYMLFKSVLWSSSISSNTIIGAACLYLLIGLNWAFVYGLIDTIDAQAFSNSNMSHSIGSYIYFSLVTLTTIGYGDVTPISPLARSFSTLEAIVGQLYLTILLARLVSIYSASSDR